MDCSEEDDSDPVIWKMANPEIIETSDEMASMEEGCLSIPGYRGEVTRPASVTVRYLDADGKEQNMQASGLLAACVQHEIDHLNGRLFIDYLSRVKRDMIIRKMTKDARLERDD
jgi:peptide deformylase